MSDAPPRLVPDEEVVETLAFGLRYEGRRRMRDADAMARVITVRLMKLLRASGYQASKTASVAVPSTTETSS